MNKKIILGLVAVVVVAGGVAGMSAYEAHIINVTAKIENALSVSTAAIDFGTVFPQEYEERQFIVNLSTSFMDDNQIRVKDVEYKIEQKPKCKDDLSGNYVLCQVSAGQTECVCPANTTALPDLCKFLSKLPVDVDNDIGVPSYYDKASNSCTTPSPDLATGRLEKCLAGGCGTGDISDCWTIDLKVPPVAGSVGQDWPASCADWTVPTDGAVYGCDLWIEVISFSYF